MSQTPRPSDNHSFQIEPKQPGKKTERDRISYKHMCYNMIRDMERRMLYVERLYAECYPEEMRQGSEKYKALYEDFRKHKERSENQIRQFKRRANKIEESVNLHAKNISRLQHEVIYNEKLYTYRLKQIAVCSYIATACAITALLWYMCVK